MVVERGLWRWSKFMVDDRLCYMEEEDECCCSCTGLIQKSRKAGDSFDDNDLCLICLLKFAKDVVVLACGANECFLGKEKKERDKNSIEERIAVVPRHHKKTPSSCANTPIYDSRLYFCVYFLFRKSLFYRLKSHCFSHFFVSCKLTLLQLTLLLLSVFEPFACCKP